MIQSSAISLPFKISTFDAIQTWLPIVTGLTIGLFFAEANLSSMYGNIILFTGIGAEGKLVTIVFDVISRKLFTYKEFEAKFKQILI